MNGTLIPELGRVIAHNWSCWLLLLFMAPLIGITAIFASAPSGSPLLPIVLTLILIAGWVLLAIGHAHERHTADRWSRGRE